jgi:hypothetical protein
MSPWEVEVTDAFTAWWNDLTEADQEAVTAHVGVLDLRRAIDSRGADPSGNVKEGASHGSEVC